MVSSSLTTLRAMPDKLAYLYNVYIEKSSQMRLDSHLSGEQRFDMITALATKASSQLQSLLNATNDAEKSIRATVAPAASASEASIAKLRWAFDNQLSVPDICQGLVADVDLDGFAALRAILPWAYRAKKIDTHDSLEQLQSNIEQYAMQIATPAQQAKNRELTEVNACINYLRQSFQTLTAFFASQQKANVVQGAFTRPASITRWFGLPGDNLPAGSIQLACDAPSFRAGSNVEPSADILKALSFNVATYRY